jgi:integrase
MASIYTRPGSPYWYASYRDHAGRRRALSTKIKIKGIDRNDTADRKRQAGKAAESLQAIASDGAAGTLTELALRKHFILAYEYGSNRKLVLSTTEKWLKGWLEECSKSTALATWKRYEGTVRFFKSVMGKERLERDIRHIEIDDALEYREALLATGKRNKTINIDCKTIKSAFERAKEASLIERNPFVTIKLLPENPIEKKAFTDDQVEAILKVCKGDWYGYSLLAYYSGARVSDLTNLKWGDLHFDAETPCLKFAPIKDQDKFKRVTTVPFHPRILRHLMTLKRGTDSDPLFPSLYGKTTGGKSGLSQSFRRILLKAGIIEELHKKRKEGDVSRESDGYGTHSFRHTFKTNLEAMGVMPGVLDTLTSHADPSVAEQYLHRTDKRLADAVNKLPEIAA